MNIPNLSDTQRSQAMEIIALYEKLNSSLPVGKHYTIQEWICAAFDYLPQEAQE